MEGDLIHIREWLLPLSWLYGIGVKIRNTLFDWGVLESRSYDVPIINVGNITMGGTGKTPHVEYVVELLCQKYEVAVLSRGYMRKSKGFVLASTESTVEEIGDEPWQIKQKFPDVHVAVDKDRRHGIEKILSDKRTRNTQVIVLDDAFQHRYVKAGMNILLVDYHRMITEDRLLPAGNLREPLRAKERAKIVIVTKCPAKMNPIGYRVIKEALALRPYQSLFYSTVKYGRMVKLNYDSEDTKEPDWRNTNILLLSGIGNPKQMAMDMRGMAKCIMPMTYRDHHFYTKADLTDMENALCSLPEPRAVVTTEKDITRLLPLMDVMSERLRDAIWIRTAKVDLLENKIKFNEKITGYVQKNLRNRSLAKDQDAHKA